MSEESTPIPDTADQDPDHVDSGPAHVDAGFSESPHSGYGEDIAEADARAAQDGGAGVDLDARGDTADDARTADADPEADRGDAQDPAGPH